MTMRDFRLAAGMVIFLPTVALAAPDDYVFTRLTPQGFHLNDPDSLNMNNDGTVVFRNYEPGVHDTVYMIRDGAMTVAFDRTGPLRSMGSIRLAGDDTVIVNGSLDTGELGIFACKDGATTTIVDDTGPFGYFASTVTNNNGDVAFKAHLDSGVRGIYAASAGTVTTIVDDTNPPGIRMYDYCMNDSGTVAMICWHETENRYVIFAGDGGPLQRVIDDSYPSLTSVGVGLGLSGGPAINNYGTIAFEASHVVPGSGEVNGVFTFDGDILTLIADQTNGFRWLGPLDINNDGQVLFWGSMENDVYGLFLGPDPDEDAVIREGDPLFGATIDYMQLIGSGSLLNDSGQVVFAARLDDGTSGIFMATPVPEPTSALLALVAVMLVQPASRRHARSG